MALPWFLQDKAYLEAEPRLIFELPSPDWAFEPNIKWMQTNWQLSIYISIVYFIAIFTGQRLMKHRKAFDLRLPLTIWNLALAIFSAWGAKILVAEVVRRLYGPIDDETHSPGLKTLLCRTTRNRYAWYWGHYFLLSKVWELGDTAFIILRKRPLTFIHYFHHMVTLMYTWASAEASTGLPFTAMNLVVHTIMYSYYALRAAGFKVPTAFAKFVTIAQNVQMFIGLAIAHYVLSSVLMDRSRCDVTPTQASLGAAMYSIYVFLFLKFYFNKYNSPEPRPTPVEGRENGVTNGVANGVTNGVANGVANGVTNGIVCGEKPTSRGKKDD